MKRAVTERLRSGWFAATLFAALPGGAAFTPGGVMASDPVRSEQPYRVVLLGASIGRSWHLPEFAARVHDRRYAVESYAVWQFDKSEMLDEVLMRPARKFHPTRTYLKSLFRPAPQPADAIILKECSAYFPGDPREQRRLVEKWVGEIMHAGIQPILATAVPVTRQRAEADPGKIEGVREYNDWVRSYAGDRRIPLLDLERALRSDPSGRYLRDDLTSGDGSHLNAKAYKILDELLHATLAGLGKNVESPRATENQ